MPARNEGLISGLVGIVQNSKLAENENATSHLHAPTPKRDSTNRTRRAARRQDRGNQPWSILPGNILRRQEERKVVMELNKETEIYLRTTMTAAFVMKLNGRPEKRGGLTFTNIVITGQFPSLNLPTVGSTNLFSWMGFTFNNFLHSSQPVRMINTFRNKIFCDYTGKSYDDSVFVSTLKTWTGKSQFG